jgi:hypothetical protein
MFCKCVLLRIETEQQKKIENSTLIFFGICDDCLSQFQFVYIFSEGMSIDAASALSLIDVDALDRERQSKKMRLSMVAFAAVEKFDKIADAKCAMRVASLHQTAGSGAAALSYAANIDVTALLEPTRDALVGVKGCEWREGQRNAIENCLRRAPHNRGVFVGRTGVGKTAVIQLLALLGVGESQTVRREAQSFVLAIEWLIIVMDQMRMTQTLP